MKKVLIPIITFVLGICVTVGANILYKAEDVSYKDTNIQEAMEEMYNERFPLQDIKGLNCSYITGYFQIPVKNYNKITFNVTNIGNGGSVVLDSSSGTNVKIGTITTLGSFEFDVSNIDILYVAAAKDGAYMNSTYTLE